jgi:hypothetical protein
MNIHVTTATTLKEWSSFLTVLNNRKEDDEPLFRKSGSPYKMMVHLQKQLVTEGTSTFQDRWYTVTKVKRKKILPGQLSIWPQ